MGMTRHNHVKACPGIILHPLRSMGQQYLDCPVLCLCLAGRKLLAPALRILGRIVHAAEADAGFADGDCLRAALQHRHTVLPNQRPDPFRIARPDFMITCHIIAGPLLQTLQQLKRRFLRRVAVDDVAHQQHSIRCGLGQLCQQLRLSVAIKRAVQICDNCQPNGRADIFASDLISPDRQLLPERCPQNYRSDGQHSDDQNPFFPHYYSFFRFRFENACAQSIHASS